MNNLEESSANIAFNVANKQQWQRFLIPSIIGCLFFLIPIYIDGKFTVGMAFIGDYIIANAKPVLINAAACFMTASIILTCLFRLNKSLKNKVTWLAIHLNFHPFWFSMRLIGCISALMYLTGIGPQWLIGANTAGTMLNNLIPITMTYLAIATVFLPLLTDFGLMELVGTLFSKVFHRLFNLPGRSAIDALASWMGSGPVGVFITAQQYEKGEYNAREAAVISTNFSIVSVSFSLVVINFIGLGAWFIPFYLTVMLIGFIAALITPRIPPLSRVSNQYIDGSSKSKQMLISHDKNLFKVATSAAITKAASAPSMAFFIKQIGRNISEIWLSLIPIVMGLGALAMVLAQNTPIFTYLAYPITPLLELLQLPNAEQAAAIMLVGFADMFLPAIMGQSIESELTRFVIATTSVSQLIYISEVGALIVKSKIPLNFKDITLIFLIRTAIALPIAAAVAHFIF